MYQIKVFNEIAEKGLKIFDDNYKLIHNDDKLSEDNPDGIILRSFNLHDYTFGDKLLAIARAGAGTNNVPVDEVTKKGVVVFNAPGANANAVKELVIAALIMTNRKIIEGIEWVESLKGQENISQLVEKGKKNFIGPEINGKTLGVIGLGSIGILTANAGHSLGMKVLGYDPYISVESAWGLSRAIKRATSMEEVFEGADYISLHVPYNKKTKYLISDESLGKMKNGVRILNFARGELVDDDAVIEALKKGKVSKYICDFPNNKNVGIENLVTVPHLGASTPESEVNCAVMVANELRDYIENGNITNSVNFPTSSLGEKQTKTRFTAIHKNIPNMVGQITAIFAKNNINIKDMINKSKNDYAYTMMDLESEVTETDIEEINKIEGMIRVRCL